MIKCKPDSMPTPEWSHDKVSKWIADTEALIRKNLPADFPDFKLKIDRDKLCSQQF